MNLIFSKEKMIIFLNESQLEHLSTAVSGIPTVASASSCDNCHLVA